MAPVRTSVQKLDTTALQLKAKQCYISRGTFLPSFKLFKLHLCLLVLSCCCRFKPRKALEPRRGTVTLSRWPEADLDTRIKVRSRDKSDRVLRIWGSTYVWIKNSTPDFAEIFVRHLDDEVSDGGSSSTEQGVDEPWIQLFPIKARETKLVYVGVARGIYSCSDPEFRVYALAGSMVTLSPEDC